MAAGHGLFAGLPQNFDLAAGVFENLPKGPSVFAIWPNEGEPYLGKTNVLARRLQRLFRSGLGGAAARVEYWQAGSRLEGNLILYELARRYRASTYLEFIKLRMPSYIRLVQSNQFPRTQITSRISGEGSRYFGPFQSRSAAEEFEHGFLDLFQLRRCQEDLEPRPDHPGCIYGEMNMCLRPCQQVVGVEEYASEAARVSDFLATGGRHLMQVTEAARDRLSAEMDFEEAARQHKRLERIEQVLKLRDALAVDIDRLNGVAVTPSATPAAVKLWFLVGGCWQAPCEFPVGAMGDKSVSMDHRLRDTAASLSIRKAAGRERQEHLALLARWFYSSWRDGEWIPFDHWDKLSYRKLTGAVSRVACQANPL